MPVEMFVVRALSHDPTPGDFESLRVLAQTGAVRVSWDRERLIGGKPVRLVSRWLRVLAWVLDQWNNIGGWVEWLLRDRLGRGASRRRGRR
jgi:hypothetical protein